MTPLRFPTNIFCCQNCTTTGTSDTRTGHCATCQIFIMLAFLCSSAFFQRWSIVLYTKDDPCFICIGFHGEHDTLVVFLAEPTGFEQRYGGAAIFAGDCTRPEVSDGGLIIYSGVEAGEISFGLLQDPPAPGAYMPGEVGLD